MDQEMGTCGVCRKENVILKRTYFHYDIKCECHSPNHFVLIIHCKDCIPNEPTETKVILSTSELKRTMAELTKEREANTKKDEALKWYADKQNWKARKRCGNCGHHLENDLDHDSAEWDEGARARSILEGNEPNEP